MESVLEPCLICLLLVTAASPAEITASFSRSASVVIVVAVGVVVTGVVAAVVIGKVVGEGMDVGTAVVVSNGGVSSVKSRFDKDLLLQ